MTDFATNGGAVATDGVRDLTYGSVLMDHAKDDAAITQTDMTIGCWHDRTPNCNELNSLAIRTSNLNLPQESQTLHNNGYAKFFSEIQEIQGGAVPAQGDLLLIQGVGALSGIGGHQHEGHAILGISGEAFDLAADEIHARKVCLRHEPLGLREIVKGRGPVFIPQQEDQGEAEIRSERVGVGQPCLIETPDRRIVVARACKAQTAIGKGHGGMKAVFRLLIDGFEERLVGVQLPLAERHPAIFGPQIVGKAGPGGLRWRRGASLQQKKREKSADNISHGRLQYLNARNSLYCIQLFSSQRADFFFRRSKDPAMRRLYPESHGCCG
ncbi:MAG: hypothetical protein R3C97_00830 [Geminicoccaceae bacterium]